MKDTKKKTTSTHPSFRNVFIPGSPAILKVKASWVEIREGCKIVNGIAIECGAENPLEELISSTPSGISSNVTSLMIIGKEAWAIRHKPRWLPWSSKSNYLK
jgi:hypothetical protein